MSIGRPPTLDTLVADRPMPAEGNTASRCFLSFSHSPCPTKVLQPTLTNTRAFKPTAKQRSLSNSLQLFHFIHTDATDLAPNHSCLAFHLVPLSSIVHLLFSGPYVSATAYCPTNTKLGGKCEPGTLCGSTHCSKSTGIMPLSHQPFSGDDSVSLCESYYERSPYFFETCSQ